MRAHPRKLPSVLLVLLLGFLALPAHPGGRDVPDSKSTAPPSLPLSWEPEPGAPGDAEPCDSPGATATVRIGSLTYEVGVEGGQIVFRPALLGALQRLALSVFGGTTGPTSCSAE